MLFLLNFFGVSPGKVARLGVTLLVLVVALMSLAGWALVERTMRLSCAVDVVGLKGDIALLEADKVDLEGKLVKQNKAVATWKAAAQVAQARRKQLEDEAARGQAQTELELARLRGDITKDQGGKGCGEALREERERMLRGAKK